jgi:hypothetical protein
VLPTALAAGVAIALSILVWAAAARADAPPVVAIDSPGAPSYTSVAVSGTVNPAGGPSVASWHFEYKKPGEDETAWVGSAAGEIYPPESEATSPITVGGTLEGLAVGTEYEVRLVAENEAGANRVVSAAPNPTFTTLAATKPTVAIDGVTPGATKAHVSWNVDPEGAPTTTYIEFSGDGGDTWFVEPFDYVGLCRDKPQCLSPAPLPAGDGTGSVPFELDFPGIGPHPSSIPLGIPFPLEPNSDYLIRARASNPGGETVTPPVGFKTGQLPPLAQTLAASPSLDGATLTGRVNPYNAPVTYQFEWGVLDGGNDQTYEHKAPAAPASLGGSGNAFRLAANAIGGLSPGTAYHYRIVATNTETGVETKGADARFVTWTPAQTPASCGNATFRLGLSAALPDCRAYEWATPGLNGTNTITSGYPIQALTDGSALAYVTFDAPDDAQASTINQPVVSRKGPNGWSTRSLGAISPEPSEAFGATAGDGLLSPDFTEGLFFSANPLLPGAVRGELNLYLRRGDDSIVRITASGQPLDPQDLQYHYNIQVTRAAADFSHIYFQSPIPQTPNAPEVNSLYEWSEGGGVALVGILPAEGSTPETPPPFGSSLPASVSSAFSSHDGRLVLFQARDAVNVPSGPLYLRIDGQRTIDVTVSQRSTPEAGPAQRVVPVGITPDGSTVYFLSSSQLTDDANTGELEGAPDLQGSDLYAYDVASGHLTDLTVDDRAEDALIGAGVMSLREEPGYGNMPYLSQDGSTIYFVAKGVLAPGGISGEPNLYMLRGGLIRFVASARGMVPVHENEALETMVGANRGFYATPDGDYAVFASTQNLTGYDSGGVVEIYKYSYPTGTLVCASCRADGQPASGAASLGLDGRTVSGDGSRVFFTSDDAVLPGLTSGIARVYEFADGGISLLSPATAARPVTFANASESGDDVFLATYEELVPGAGHDFNIYDAGVEARPPLPPPPECREEACRSAGSAAAGNSPVGTDRRRVGNGIGGPKRKVVVGRKLKLRVTVPTSGRLKVTGKGLRSVRRRIAKPGSATVVVALTRSADKRRLKRGVFRTKARISFVPQGSAAGPGGSSTTTKLTFKAGRGRGGK